MISNYERFHEIQKQADSESYSSPCHVEPRNLPRSPYLWLRWSGPLSVRYMHRYFLLLDIFTIQIYWYFSSSKILTIHFFTANFLTIKNIGRFDWLKPKGELWRCMRTCAICGRMCACACEKYSETCVRCVCMRLISGRAMSDCNFAQTKRSEKAISSKEYSS